MTRLMVIDAISWPNTTSICSSHPKLLWLVRLSIGARSSLLTKRRPVIFTIRVYALWSCSKRILTFLCVLVILIVTLAVWTLVTAPEDNVPEDNTCPQPGISSEIASRHALLWGCLMSFDVAIFVLTVLRTWRSFYSGSHRRSNMPLTDLLLRDGKFSCCPIS
jgi:hypothetical protein